MLEENCSYGYMYKVPPAKIRKDHYKSISYIM